MQLLQKFPLNSVNKISVDVLICLIFRLLSGLNISSMQMKTNQLLQKFPLNSVNKISVDVLFCLIFRLLRGLNNSSLQMKTNQLLQKFLDSFVV